MDEDQEYLLTLQGIFNSCSTTGSPRLNRDELQALCYKLELKEQSDTLIQTLLETQTSVDFETFKDGFLNILSETIDSSEDEADQSHHDQAPTDQPVTMAPPKQPSPEVSPKYVHGDKRYGRRSRPETDTEGDMSDTDHSFSQSPRHTPLAFKSELSLRLASLEDELDEALEQEERAAPSATSSKRTPPKRKSPKLRSPSSISPKSLGSDRSRSRAGSKSSETYEAEGQMEGLAELAEERRHMELIWRELGVGAEGFLTLEELGSVCERIGMEEMNPQELQHLFDKLDVDGDGKVSFDEFLQGLFQYGGPTTSTPSRQTATTPRQVTTPRQKLRMSMAGQLDENRQTPSLVMAAGSGLFSALDTDNTGFVKADAIIELWESFGVAQGAEILEYLQFNLSAKISLIDLTYALEQELHSIEDDNATYQAAIATYEYELRHLKGSTDHLMAERDKLRGDLVEANSRIALLVKEGDDRHSTLERSKERELNSLERKYEEQIRILQAEIDRERQSFQNQSSSQRVRLEDELQNLRDEETKLREKLNNTTKDFERLEVEVLEMATKCGDLEEQNVRQQRELAATAELHRRLEELESNRDHILDEQQRFSEQRLHQLQAENQELKDKADELTIELEELHQQAALQRRQRQRGFSGERRRAGSTLAEYTPPGLRDDSAASDEASDVESPRLRKKKHSPVDEPVSLHTVKLQDELDQLKLERESLLTRHDESLTSVKTENRELIIQLTDKHRESLTAAQTEHNMKLDELRSRHAEELQKQKAESEDRLKSEIRRGEEKLSSLREDYEAKIRDLHSKNSSNLSDLTSRHEKEVAELERKHAEDVKVLESKLEALSSETDVRKEELQALNRGFSIERKDIEDAFKMEIAEMEDRHMQEKNEILQEHRKEKEDMEVEFQQRMESVVKDREAELTANLEQERESWVIKTESEKNLLRHEHQQELDRMSAQHDEAISAHELELSRLADDRKNTSHSQSEEFQQQLAEVEKAQDLQREEFEKEREDLLEKHAQEKSALVDQHQREIYDYDNKLAEGVKGLDGKLKTDFYRLLVEHKDALEAELRAELRAESDLLQEQERSDLQALQQLERKNLENELAEDRKRLQRDIEQQQADLAEQIKREKGELAQQVEREKAEFISRLSGEKALWQKDVDSQHQDVISQLKQQADARETEFQHEKEALSKFGVVAPTGDVSGVSSGVVCSSEMYGCTGEEGVDGELMFETKEVQREVSHLLYDVQMESEKLCRSAPGDHIGSKVTEEPPVVLREKESFSKSKQLSFEKELFKSNGSDSSCLRENVNQRNLLTSEKLVDHMDHAKDQEHIIKDDSVTVTRENAVCTNGKVSHTKECKHDVTHVEVHRSSTEDEDVVDSTSSPLTGTELARQKTKNFTSHVQERMYSDICEEERKREFPGKNWSRKNSMQDYSDQIISTGFGAQQCIQDDEIIVDNIVSEPEPVKPVREKNLLSRDDSTKTKLKVKKDNSNKKVQKVKKTKRSKKSKAEVKVEDEPSTSSIHLSKTENHGPSAQKQPTDSDAQVSTNKDEASQKDETQSSSSTNPETFLSEKDRTRILKEIQKEREVITRTRYVGRPGEHSENTEPKSSMDNSVTPQTETKVASQPVQATKPRVKPKLEKPVPPSPKASYQPPSRRKGESSILVTIFSVLLKAHADKNGW